MSRIAMNCYSTRTRGWWWWWWWRWWRHELILENRVPCFGTNQCFIHGMRLGHVEKGMAVRNPKKSTGQPRKWWQNLAIYGNLWQSHGKTWPFSHGKGLIHQRADGLPTFCLNLRQQLLKLPPSVRCRCPAWGGCPSRLDELRTLTGQIWVCLKMLG